MPTLAAQLQAILRRALDALPEPPPADFDAPVSPSADARFGDYQSNAAMTLAKARRTNPRALAAQIVEASSTPQAELGKISAPPEIAGAGFINFRLKAEKLAETFRALDADPARLGVPEPKEKRGIVIDFSGPNIAKPMHVGHLRSTIIGDCLARVARFVGHEVITDNHLGDWGTQFGKVIYGWKHFLDEKSSPPIRWQSWCAFIRRPNTAAENDPAAQRHPERRGQYVEPKATSEFVEIASASPALRTRCRAELAKLQSGDPENLAIWQRCVDLSRAELDKIYAELDVRFDHQFGESFFNDKLAPSSPGWNAKTAWPNPAKGQSSRSSPTTRNSPSKPAIIRKRDGAFNYATTDIATYEQRVDEFHADTLWYVVGAPQALHFEQLNAIVRRMGYTVPLTHIPFGSILGEDRKIMRTRSGENVALRDLLDEAVERARAVVEQKNADLPADEKTNIARIIGLGAVKYAEFSQHRLTDYIFSWDRMLSFQGNTAPYLQNAYVRIQSDLPALEGDRPASGWRRRAGVGADRTGRAEISEESLRSSPRRCRPCWRISGRTCWQTTSTNWRTMFHTFYEACPVLKADEGSQRETRLTLCRVTARTLRVGLGLLGIEVPERM